jgi:hypothetical protein
MNKFGLKILSIASVLVLYCNTDIVLYCLKIANLFILDKNMIWSLLLIGLKISNNLICICSYNVQTRLMVNNWPRKSALGKGEFDHIKCEANNNSCPSFQYLYLNLEELLESLKHMMTSLLDMKQVANKECTVTK